MITKQEFEDFYKDHSNTITCEHFKIPRSQLSKLLKEWDIEAHSGKENTKLTLIYRYGVTNSRNIPYVKEKYKDLFGPSGSPFSKKEVRDKRDKTVKEKYNVDNVFQIKEVKDKIKEIQIEKYGAIGYMASYQKDKFKLYKVGNLYFDSSWEVALYIYAIEHNEEIVREPIKFTYVYMDKIHEYIPDFLYKGNLIEIKGDQFFDDAGNLCDVSRKQSNDLYREKQKCMTKNNVIIYKFKEIKPYLDYMENIYGKDWRNNYKHHSGSK